MSTQPYSGEEKLVFAIDCGTTMSAISFVHLLHGVIPQIRVVSRWPYQEDATGNCKFPTTVRYDNAGKAVAFGAEALENPDGLQSTFLARWFKLLLHPKEMRDETAITAPPLPPGVALKTVYADFLGYAFKHARDFFKASTIDGPALWQRLKKTFELVFAIPNGWTETQQTFIRDAVVNALILPSNFAQQRLHFVPEAEASVHFAVEHMNVAHLMRVGQVFAVLDAGGSTVDTTIYRCEAIAPRLRLVEVTASECVQAGSVFIDRAFENYVRALLAGSKFCLQEHVDEMVQVFESKTKRRFTGQEDHVIVQFGRNSDNDRPRGIRMGRLTIERKDMCNTFQTPIAAITASVCRILRRAPVPCRTFLLVGGFAESPYLRSALQEGLEYRGLHFVFSDEPTTKAAAEGACSWRVKQYVSARAARCTYGVEMNRLYNSSSAIHYERRSKVYVNPAGDLVIPGTLDRLVRKNQVIQNDQPISHEYRRVYDCEPTDLGSWTDELLVSDTEDPGPWAVDHEGEHMPGIRLACTLTADLSGLRGNVQRLVNPAGNAYWMIDYEIEIFFGRTSLCAAVVWEEKGITKRGPVAVIPNSLI